MDEQTLDLLIDLHAPHERQGPGSRATTERAIELAGLRERAHLRVADLGCGTGASALVLAEVLDARITAVDLSGAFLRRLRGRAAEQGWAERIHAVEASIDSLPLGNRSFDVIWCEGAIYTIGFERGARAWRGLLKPGGVLVVSELTWTTPCRPKPVEEFWGEAYPAIDTASGKMRVLEEAGYSPIGYFPLPPECWTDEYYNPLEANFGAFLERHEDRPEAARLVEAERQEIALYRRYGAYYSYGMYIARRPREETGDDCRR